MAISSKFANASGVKARLRAKHPARTDSRITFRVTSEEKQQLAKWAEGRPVSETIRERLFSAPTASKRIRLGRTGRDQVLLSQILGMLGQSGISENLSHIAAAASLGALNLDNETRQTLTDTRTDIARIRHVLFQALDLKPPAVPSSDHKTS